MSFTCRQREVRSPRNPRSRRINHFLRIVRDQANRTFDLYLSRIRKYGTTLPETVLPLPNTATTNGTTPRMGTPQNDTSWAGWAISSFTNKISTASGDIEAKPNPTASHTAREPRSSSAPPKPSTEPARPNTSSESNLHRKALSKPVPPTLMRTTTDQFFGDAQAEDDELDEAWGEMGEDSFFDSPTTPAITSPTPFDDGGEPDFAGWLSAQVQSKSKAPLPKGLSKPKPSPVVNGRPAPAKGASTGSVGASTGLKKLAATKPSVPKAKIIDTKPKESAADDDWGDAWD